MSSETCTSWSNMRKLLRENTDSEVFFEKYSLSEKTVARLESVRKKIKDDTARANPVWKMVMGECEEHVSSESEDNDGDGEANASSQMKFSQSGNQPSTQFYFSQVEPAAKASEVANPVTSTQKCDVLDILESLREGLERNNGRLDFSQLEGCSDEDLVLLVDRLAERLSPKGVYNICQSMSNMNIEERIKYLNIFCTYLLLPKIIELEEPSRLLSSAIGECVKTFPDEIRQFIFIPLLNVELKEITLITIIINTFDFEKKAVLLEDFLASVKELKSWHISILQNFLSVRLDHDKIDKITKLFSGKALSYSKDKNFGKLVLSFLKINTILSEKQKNVIAEVAAINETLFKKPIENLLKNM